MSISLDYASSLGAWSDKEGYLHWLRVEKHAWGYFLEDSEKAVAVVGSWAQAVEALRQEWGRSITK